MYFNLSIQIITSSSTGINRQNNWKCFVGGLYVILRRCQHVDYTAWSGGMTTWKELSKRRSISIRDTIPPFAWIHWRKPQQTSIRTADVLGEIPTENIPNTTLQIHQAVQYCLSAGCLSPLGEVTWSEWTFLLCSYCDNRLLEAAVVMVTGWLTGRTKSTAPKRCPTRSATTLSPSSSYFCCCNNSISK
jgi:hypothetical protein